MDSFTVEEIKVKLATNRSWQERAILRLFAAQTADEQVAQVTTHKNAVGFSSFDAEILSSFAKQLGRPGYRLSVKQQAIASKRLPKYAKQLWQISQGQVVERATARSERAVREEKTAAYWTGIQTQTNEWP